MAKNWYVFTGPPGAGKTSVIDHLAAEFDVVCEPARRIIASQKASEGRGTSDRDPVLFVSLMLQTALSDAETAPDGDSIVLFDRALPDLLAYAEYYDLNRADILRAVETVRFAPKVFWFPAWEDIYTTDADRTLDFAASKQFGVLIRKAYLASGYELVTVPRSSIEHRAAFIRDRL